MVQDWARDPTAGTGEAVERQSHELAGCTNRSRLDIVGGCVLGPNSAGAHLVDATGPSALPPFRQKL